MERTADRVAQSAMTKRGDVTITTLFDNYLARDDLKALWGFSCYVEISGRVLLFDTGSNGRVLLQNARTLQKDLGKTDTLFLSHHHWDHIGGVDSLIELKPDIDLVVPSSLSKNLIRDLRSMTKSVLTVDGEGRRIGDDLYSTGLMGDEVKEQSLIIDTDAGLIVITGCAHSGIVNIVKKAKALLGREVLLLLGGFHLVYNDTTEIDGVIGELKKEGVAYVSPTHCSGDLAIERFRDAFGERFIAGGAGSTIELGRLIRQRERSS